MSLKREHTPAGRADTWAYGVCFDDVMEAAEVCPDTSVLEKLFPWAFATGEGRELLEKKKAEAEAQEDSRRKKHFKSMVDSETKIDVDKGGVVTIQMNTKTAEVLRSVIGRVAGPPVGPAKTIEKIFVALRDKGIKCPKFEYSGALLEMPSTVQELERDGFHSNL